MRHELPLAVGDPFLLAVVDGRTHIMVSTIERARVAAAAPDAELHDITDLGFHELLRTGMSREELSLELVSRAAARIGVRDVVVDPELPVAVADRLREDGIMLRPDREAIAARRRVKSAAELDGIRRAQAAAGSTTSPATSSRPPVTEPSAPARVRTGPRDFSSRSGTASASRSTRIPPSA